MNTRVVFAILAACTVFVPVASFARSSPVEKASHPKQIYSSTLPGNGPNATSTFVLSYKSSVKSRRQQYKKNFNEVHCKWGYSNLTLDRTLTLKLKSGGERVIGTAQFVKRIPSDFPDDSTKEKCGLIIANSIGPAVDKMNSAETWVDVMREDSDEVSRLISIPIQQ